MLNQAPIPKIFANSKHMTYSHSILISTSDNVSCQLGHVSLVEKIKKNATHTPVNGFQQRLDSALCWSTLGVEASSNIEYHLLRVSLDYDFSRAIMVIMIEEW